MATTSPYLRRLCLSLAIGCAAVGAFAADKDAVRGTPHPAMSFSLAEYGYRPVNSAMALRLGYANATIHFVDPSHVLLTYSTHKLLPRLRDQREGDDDHAVRALVLHLPDGKVVHETEWRMHDRTSYLWPLTKGRFLLRLRSDLYAIDPLGSRAAEHLGEQQLLQTGAELQGIEFSPQRDMLLVQTAPAPMIGDDPREKKESPVTGSFYQVVDAPGGGVRLRLRGNTESKDAFSLAFTSMGVLQTMREDRTHWAFDFHAFDGTSVELAGFTSTCKPSSYFLSDAEFFSLGCRGGEDRKLMAGFNLMAEANWVFTTDDAPLWLAVATAPGAGRFAVRNTLAAHPDTRETDQLAPDDIRQQEVRVYGMREGFEILRVQTSPAQKPGQNFALSPDGLRLAVLHGTQLEVYDLPPVSKEDRVMFGKEEEALKALRPAAEGPMGVKVTGGKRD